MSDENERSAASDGSVKCEPAAWLVDGGEYQYVSLFRESADAAANEEGGAVTPLYRSPTLTDAEREAVAAAIGWIESPSAEDEAMPDDYLPITDALRGLLKRTAL